MTDEAASPLRRRVIEDMTIRKFAPKTQHDYVQRVKNFAAFLGRSPDTASFEDVRRYQLHLTASGVGVPTINQTVSTLRARPPQRICARRSAGDRRSAGIARS
jgi:integrase/recombinase XerD